MTQTLWRISPPLLRWAIFFFVVAAASGVTGDAWAQAWPAKPVRIVVPFQPGGATDVLARLVASKLVARLGQQVIVDNRPGAGGNIAANLVAKAPADGYMLFIASDPGLTTAPSLTKDAGFDPARDFAAVTLLATQTMLLNLHPSMPPNSVREFVAYAKARPGQLTYATPGIGSPHHLAMEMFKHTAGIDLVHVPYRGGAPMTLDVVAGQVPVMFGSYVIAGPHLQTGKLKAIGGSGAARVTQAPEIPTIAEQGYPGFDVTPWFGLVAPTGTPAAVIARLTDETHAVLALAEVKERLFTIGFDPAPVTSSDAFGARIKADIAKWGKVIRDTNIKAD